MANPSVLGEITYEAESAFGEDVDTVTTLKLPIVSAVDVTGLVHNKLESGRIAGYRNGRRKYILGTMGGSFKTDIYLAGHGSSTAGATALTAVETLLGIVFGNAAVSASAGTTLTGGTATAPTTTASGTFSAGSLCFIGALADGRGNGQAYAISTHSGNTLNLLTGLPLAGTNGDVLYSAVNIYPSESPTATTITSVRMLLATANLQYLCHGCHPVAVQISGLGPGELPKISITWNIAWWEYKASTFPNTVASDSSNPSAVAAGSLFVNTVGTATSSLRTMNSFTIDYTLGVETIRGSGGVNAYQDIVACRRTVDMCTVTWTEAADAATTSPVVPGFGTGTNQQHILYTSATAAGSRLAIYLPNVCSKLVAIQKMDSNLNRLTYTGETDFTSTTTTDHTLSHFRMAMG